jgi:hypothetical protein
MIKRYSSQAIRYISATALGWVSSIALAHADTSGGGGSSIFSLFGLGLNALLAEIAAWISNIVLTIMGLWVTLTGALLNVSINLTLKIKDFVDSTQGVYVVWQSIRDITGMFIIFMLLYASFKMILSRDDVGTSVGRLITNVVIMGVLINFSFFIVSLMIDASNIVSLTLYRDIVITTSGATPASSNACPPQSGLSTCNITQQMFNGTEGGISDVFLTYLKPQSAFGFSSISDPNAPADAKPLEILIQGIVGSVIMFTIGLSFLLASLAFVIRFIILVLLLAFSPIWMAAYALPELKTKAEHFTKHLKEQLLFMPVYMLLLYASMRILTSSTVFTNPSGNAFSGSGSSLSFIPMNYIVLAVNDFFIIFLLNIPLVTAMAMGGVASEWIDTKKLGAEKIWKMAGGYVGTRTAGRWAGSIDKKLGNTKLGNTLLARDIRSGTLGAVAKSKMGAERNYEELVKAQGDVAKKAKEIDRDSQIKDHIASSAAGKPYVLNKDGKPVISDLFGKTNEKEKLALVGDNIDNKEKLKEIAKHMKKSDFEAIKKSEDFTDEDKDKIKTARTEAFKSAVDAGQGTVVKHMMENMEVEDLLKHADKLDSDQVVANLKPGLLKKLAEEGLSSKKKKEIGARILEWDRDGNPLNPRKDTHSCLSFIEKDQNQWL